MISEAPALLQDVLFPEILLIFLTIRLLGDTPSIAAMAAAITAMSSVPVSAGAFAVGAAIAGAGAGADAAVGAATVGIGAVLRSDLLISFETNAMMPHNKVSTTKVVPIPIKVVISAPCTNSLFDNP